MGVEGIERLARRLAPALDVTQHDHALSRVQELSGHGLEVVPVAPYRAENVVGYGFGAVVGAPLWQSLYVGLLSFDFRVHKTHHGIDVGSVERLVSFAQDVHVLFGHAYAPFQPAGLAGQPFPPQAGCHRYIDGRNFRELPFYALG